jgi:hypothetical protein
MTTGMSQMTPLEYATYKKPGRFSHTAIVAFIGGLLSGPAGLLIAFILGCLPLRADTQIVLSILALIACLLLPPFFAIGVWHELRPVNSPRGRRLALAGIFAVVVWTAAFIGIVTCGIGQFD